MKRAWIGSSPHSFATARETNLKRLEEVTVAMRVAKCQILSALTISVLLWVLPAACLAQETGSQTPAGHPGSAKLGSKEEGRFQLPQNALQVARITGVDSDLAKLSTLAPSKDLSTSPGSSLGELLLREQITETIVAASLDVDSVLDEIDYERAQIVELRSILRARRDRAIGTTNAATLAVGTGLGVVAGALSFSKTTSDAGNAIGFASGGLSTLLSLRGYRQVHGGKRPASALPNMLAPFFGEPEEIHSHYPDDIWTYLNSVPPGGTSEASRKEQLLAAWLAAGRFGPLDSPRSKQKIALLTSTHAGEKKLDIELLNERAAMLADVRNLVSLMKHDLRDLLRGLRQK